MEGMLTFTGIVIIVFGILQIILFFKLWGMTNNVSRIKDLIEANLPINHITNRQNSQTEGSKLIDDIHIGDSIIRLSDGKKMIVDSIENGKYFCKISFFEGYKYFDRAEIEPYNR